jgi:hypothetical protein
VVTEATPHRHRWTRSPYFGGGIVVLVALVARLPGYLHQLIDLDESAIATMAMVVNRGGVLYRDVIDRKPPLAAFVYAASFLITGNRDLRPLHVVAALALAASALTLAWGARRVGGATAGWWAAGLLIAGTTALQPHDAQAANFAHLALLPGCAAIVAARVGSWRSSLLAGLLVGVATLTRQTWVIGVVPAAYAAWWFGDRRWHRPAAVVVAAGATIAAVGIVPFSSFWHWTFAGNGSVLSFGQSLNVEDRAGIVFEVFLLANLVTCWLVARRGWRRTDLDLWLWLGAGLVAFVAGYRFFGHYWLQVLPPLCLLAGLGAASCRPRRRRVLAAVVVIPAVAAWGYALVRPPRIGGGVVAPLARYVVRHTRPGELVGVWGSASDLYWRSGRGPGGALVSTDFVVGRTAGRRDGPARLADATPGALTTYLSSLRAHPPVLFLDTSTSGLRGYRNYPLSTVPAVDRFVRSHYEAVGTLRGVTVYRYRSPR